MTKHVHFIGIEGVGMSALAIIAKQKGYKVTGSDDKEYPTGQTLHKHGIEWIVGFDARNLKKKPDIVVVSAAFDDKNPEVLYAKEQKMNILPYSEFLWEIMSDFRCIAVSGIHGKTTTTSMVAFLMEKGGMDPSYFIGCKEAVDLGTNAKLGGGEFFVTEADEYKKSAEDLTSKFLDFKPEMAIITSIEMDHPDVFKTEEDVYRTFFKFACKLPRTGTIVGCIDSDRVKKLSLSLADRKFESYGFAYSADWRIVDYEVSERRQIFTIRNNNYLYGPFELEIPGKHNVLNATAAIIVCIKAGVDVEVIQKYLPEFRGAERRSQKMGQKNGVVVIDDYAHHPTAIRSTLEGMREFYPGRRIVCVFQPHTYSRTKELFDDFAQSFGLADVVLIMDIFASAREKSGRIHSRHLVVEASKYHKNVNYMGSLLEVNDFLEENLQGGDLLLVMGAGDVYKVGLEYLSEKGAQCK